MNTEVLNVIPIITPQKYFINQYGIPDAYCTNNLALYIEDNGYITMLIRNVNYKRFHNKVCITGFATSMSEYSMLSGPDFNHLEYQDIIYDWGVLPQYPTHWFGMEDIRFIDRYRLLITCPERNTSGIPCLFYGVIKNNVITLLQRLEPSRIEKNWLPYGNEDKLIYHVSPFTIKSIFKDDRMIIDIGEEQSKLEGYHGSTNCVPYKGELLFLTHLYTDKTVHRWVTFNPETLKVKVSKPFSYMKHSFIEINSSLQYYNGIYYVTLAIHEDKIYVVTFTKKMISQKFK